MDLHGIVYGTAPADTFSNVRTVLTNYEPSNREIPTINVVGFLLRSGLRVIVYRLLYREHLIKQVVILIHY